MKTVVKVMMLVALIQCAKASAQTGWCLTTLTYSCQYSGAQFYTCDGVTYPVMGYNNSGVWYAATNAYQGVDNSLDDSERCTWSYTYTCDGIESGGSGFYMQDGSIATGEPCWLAKNDKSPVDRNRKLASIKTK